MNNLGKYKILDYFEDKYNQYYKDWVVDLLYEEKFDVNDGKVNGYVAYLSEDDGDDGIHILIMNPNQFFNNTKKLTNE